MLRTNWPFLVSWAAVFLAWSGSANPQSPATAASKNASSLTSSAAIGDGKDLVFFIHLEHSLVPLACYIAKASRFYQGPECLRYVPNGAKVFVETVGPLPTHPITEKLRDDVSLPALNIKPQEPPLPGYSVWPPHAVSRVHRIATEPDLPIDHTWCRPCNFRKEIPAESGPALSVKEAAALTSSARQLDPGKPERRISIYQTVKLDLDRDGKLDRLISLYLQTPRGPEMSADEGRHAYEESISGSVFLLSSNSPDRVQSSYRRGHTILATVDFKGNGELAVLLEWHDLENIHYYLIQKDRTEFRELGCFDLGPGPGLITHCF